MTPSALAARNLLPLFPSQRLHDMRTGKRGQVSVELRVMLSSPFGRRTADDLGRQMLLFEDFVVREHLRPFDRIDQLTHITGPAVVDQGLPCVRL